METHGSDEMKHLNMNMRTPIMTMTMNIRLTMTMNILLYDYVDECRTTGGEGRLPEEWSDRPWVRCSSASSPPRPGPAFLSRTLQC